VLTPFQSNLVTFLVQQYNLEGKLLSADQAFNQYGIPNKDYTDALNSEDVREALAERGVVFERFNDDFTAESLTATQLLVANSLLDLTDTRTNKKKLQDLGVATSTYATWLKDPVFKAYMHRRAEQMIGDNQHEVDTALLDKVRSGDLKAIAYYNEYTGRFVQQKSGTNVDVSQLIVKIIEIIDEEIDDPATLNRVSLRLKGMIAARNTANALMGGDADAIVVPEVVKARPLELEDTTSDDADPGAAGLPSVARSG
jgi:hypothetical protein